MKTIKDILSKVSVEGVLGTTSNTVSGIYFDSRDVKLDSLYVAQKGELLDGHDFISQAIDRNRFSRSVVETARATSRSL